MEGLNALAVIPITIFISVSILIGLVAASPKDRDDNFR
jgi:hypothetical protein